jgi:hypothetical protein
MVVFIPFCGSIKQEYVVYFNQILFDNNKRLGVVQLTRDTLKINIKPRIRLLLFTFLYAGNDQNVQYFVANKISQIIDDFFPLCAKTKNYRLSLLT